MYVPMPFPYCARCGKQWDGTAVHTDCGGMLELNPDDRTIHCIRCNGSWPLYDSVFHCPHKHTFAAHEIEDVVDELVEDCKLVAEELAIMQNSFSRRRAMADESRRDYVRNSLEEIGFSVSKMAGYAFERLVDFVLDLFRDFLLR